MLKHKRLFLPSVVAFLLLQLVLGVLIQTTSGDACKILSFSSVLAACLFFLLFCEKNCKYIFTQAGLLLTVCADVFLVLLDAEQKLVAMILFSFAQLFYARRIYLYSVGDSIKRAHIISRLSAVILSLLLTVLVLGKGADAVSLISMFYYANLLVNIIFAFLDGKDSLIFAIGLLLFALCDAAVGLSLIDTYLPVSADSFIYRIANANVNLAWLFYVPSQTLIAISTAFFKKDQKAGEVST